MLPSCLEAAASISQGPFFLFCQWAYVCFWNIKPICENKKSIFCPLEIHLKIKWIWHTKPTKLQKRGIVGSTFTLSVSSPIVEFFFLLMLFTAAASSLPRETAREGKKRDPTALTRRGGECFSHAMRRFEKHLDHNRVHPCGLEHSGCLC